MTSKAKFVAYVYEDDYSEIQKLVQQYPNIETGGDLFGLWKDEKTVIIQQFIGPGKNCERTTTSFHQDIEYLHRVGSLITTEEGLCNVGEWHSHHQIGMPEPSGADRRTVFGNMPQLGLERFVLFIATIESTGSSGKKRRRDVKLSDIELRPFLFLASTQKVVKGEIEIISGSNPHRLNGRAEIEDEIKSGKEPTPKHIEEDSGPGKPEKDKKKDPIHAEKPKNVLTLKQQATPRVEAQGRHGQSGGAQSSSDHESVGGKPQDDQQRRRREQDQKTGKTREGERNQTQILRDGFNNENWPPNTNSAPTDHGPHSLPTYPTSQMNNPLQSGTTQSWGLGTQRHVPQTTSAPTSLREVWDASSRSGQGHGIQTNMPRAGAAAYSGPRSPQHPSYTQQTSQRSARDHDHGAQYTGQAQAKDRGASIPVGKMGAKGFF